MRSRRLAVAGVLAGITLTLASMATTAEAVADEGSPSATVGTGSAQPGEVIEVSGESWPTGTMVRVSTCGQLGLRGSASCDRRTVAVVPVTPEGTFQAAVAVGRPPEPCPCVIGVATVGDGAVESLDIPFEVKGQQYAEVELEAPTLPVRIDEVEIGGGESLATRFGAAVTRTLTLTLTNPGTTALVDLPVRAEVGADGDLASADVVGDVDRIEAGETVTARVPVELPAGAIGEYEVRGMVAETGPFVTSTTHTPWGLFALVPVGLLLAGWALLRPIARRRQRRLTRVGDADLPEVSYIPGLGGYLVREDSSLARRLRKHAGGTLAFRAPEAGEAGGTGGAEASAGAAVPGPDPEVVGVGALDALFGDTRTGNGAHRAGDTVDRDAGLPS